MDDVPLICDPVPGPAPLPAVLISERMLTDQEVALLRARWEEANTSGRSMILEPHVTMFSVWQRREWPDAEFCAA